MATRTRAVQPQEALLDESGAPATGQAPPVRQRRNQTVISCGGCRQRFATTALFDAHRHQRGEHGGCLNPSTVTDGFGNRTMFLRDGVWSVPR